MSTPELPLLSIVIVAYQSRAEIGGCLGSLPEVLADRRVEVIVVDNSPGEGTGELIRQRFPHVTYCAPGDNLGFARANNLGYAQARGEFILFLNPDTVCTEVALLHCIRQLEADPEIGLISPRLMQPSGKMDLACRRSIPNLWDGFCRAAGLAARFPDRPLFAGYNLTYLPPGECYDVGAINGAFMLGPREVFSDYVAPDGKVFDERFFMYGDDLDLCIRVGRAGFRVVYDGRVQIIHLKGVSVARDFERMSLAIFDANRDVFLKHFNPRGSAWVRWKFIAAFGAWKWFALARARLRGHRRVQPL